MINLILILLFITTKSERDLIGSNKFDKTLLRSKWYNTKDYKGSWLIENVLSFLGNGWHLNDWINVSIAYYFFGLLVGNLWYGAIAFIIGGTYHSLRNGSLLRKHK